ncbi:MAG: hypothetical protein IH962_06015 [Chloroflexi bacterium]|nr:hypothetical protein [Chloroflexota bacterium]
MLSHSLELVRVLVVMITKFCMLILGLGFVAGCGGNEPEPGAAGGDSGEAVREPGGGEQPTEVAAVGEFGWYILPQFPPREQVISRRLLGLNDLVMLDDNTAWIVGTDGAVGRTTNGGETFVLQATGTAINLTGVSFIDELHGWAIGTAGTVLRTSDGGDTWDKLESIPGVLLPDGIEFLNETMGWAVTEFGGIWQTTDGGDSWTKKNSGTLEDFLDIQFFDPQTGWAVGYAGTILKTTDGGESWTAQTAGTDVALHRVSFVDANIGATVGGAGTILTTTDGGATWVSQSSGIDQDLFGVFVYDSQNMWAVGEDNTIIESKDGGVTWTKVATPTSGDTLRAVQFTTLRQGLAAGSGGHIWRFGVKPEN